ncbi:MAG: lysophospholipid acyltransferase family protein [Rubrivivax sp.]|nr:lysophospholipid acyltransferase family protein [Rubrivivax sp.]
MRLLLYPFTWLMLQAMLLVLGLFSIAWNLAAVVAYPLLSRERGRHFGRAGIARGYRWFWRIAGWSGLLRMDARALDAMSHEPGLIVIANHPSMLDAVMLVARLPRSFCVMKAGLARNPLLGPAARLARYIRNDSAVGMVRRAVSELKAGGQLVMFPEGTRTTVPPINAFRPGVTLIAKLAQAPIQAVFIDTESPYLGKGWPLWRLPPLPIVFKVRLGERFAPEPDTQALLTRIEAYFAQQVRVASRPGR